MFRKMVKKQISVAAAIFMAVSSMTAVNAQTVSGAKLASNQTQKIKLNFWTNDKALNAPELDVYKKQNPNVEIEATYQGGYDEIVQKVQIAIAANTLPDFAVLGQRHGIPQMYDSGKLLAIEDLVSKDIINDILPALWDRFTYKGKKITIPFKSSAPSLYYNKKMFETAGLQPPKTMDEVLAAAKKLKVSDARPAIYGINFADDTPWYIQPLIWNQDKTVIDKDGKITLNTPEVVKAFDYLRIMTHVDKSMPANQHKSAKTDFTNGIAAMYIGSCSSYDSIVSEAKGKVDVGLTYFPAINSRNIPIGGNSLGVFKSTDAKVAASTKVVEFLLLPDNTLAYTMETGYIAVRKSVTESAKFLREKENNPAKVIIYDQFQYLKGQNVNPADSLIWQSFDELISKVEADPNTNIKAELDAIQKKVDLFMQDYKK